MSLPLCDHNPKRWNILVLLFAMHVMTTTGMFGFQVLLPQMKTALHLDHAQVGGLMASYFLGISLISPFSGVFVDRFGVRRSIIIGSLMIGGSLVMIARFPVLLFMIILLIIAGTGHSLLTPSSNKAVMYWFEDRSRATAMGIKQTGINGGGLLASIVISFLAAAAGWPHALLAAGLVAMSASVMILVFYHYSFQGLAAVTPGFLGWRRQMKKVLARRDILLLALEGFFRVAVQMGFLTYLLLYLQRELELSLATASLMYAVAQLGGATGRISLGLLSDRIFGGRRKIVYSLSGLLAASCFLVFGQFDAATPVWAVFAIIVILGFTAVGHQGVGLALLAEIAGVEFTGVASGFCQFLFFMGVVLVSPLIGYVIDLSGSFSYAWMLLAMMSLTCCAILNFVRELPKLKPEQILLATRKS